jgi:hypothetical protein
MQYELSLYPENGWNVKRRGRRARNSEFKNQHPSMLNFQEAMEKKRKRNNLRALFGVEKTPGADQIRRTG